MTKLQELVHGFRRRVEQELEVDAIFGEESLSFEENIRQVRAGLKSARSAEEKLQMITHAIQGSGRISSMSGEKLFAFNETVVAPLQVLKHTMDSVDKFLDDCTRLNRNIVVPHDEEKYDVNQIEEHLKDLIQTIWAVSGTNYGLVEVRIDGSDNLILDMSGLIDCTERLLKATKECT